MGYGLLAKFHWGSLPLFDELNHIDCCMLFGHHALTSSGLAKGTVIPYALDNNLVFPSLFLTLLTNHPMNRR